MSSLGRNKSFIQKLEGSALVDIATIGVIAFNAYVIYGSLGYRADVTSFASTTEVLAVQLSTAAIVLYALEFIVDKLRSGGRY